MTHGALTESSVSDPVVTHDRKGREGKGREIGGEVGSCCIVSTGSASANLRALPLPSMHAVASLRVGDL